LARNRKIGIALSAIAVLIMIFGTIGYTAQGQVEGLPTPNVEGFVFFSDEAIPSNQSRYLLVQRPRLLGTAMMFSSLLPMRIRKLSVTVSVRMEVRFWNRYPIVKPVNLEIMDTNLLGKMAQKGWNGML
jgi:hypothetical protein